MSEVPSQSATCSRLRPALGSFVSVHSVASTKADAERANAAAFEVFAAVNRLMHPVSGQDLVELHAARIGDLVRVHPWTWNLLALSAEINDASEGCFDPCLPECAGSMLDVELPETGVVVLRKRVALDLGGIAKGFAVDRAIEQLMAVGCIGGQVNAGGDMRVFGDAAPLWLRTNQGVRCITLRGQACALSDPLASDPPPEHRGYYKRRDPVEPGELNAAAAVVASTAATADALTKCVLLCRRDAPLLKRVLSRFDAKSIDLA